MQCQYKSISPAWDQSNLNWAMLNTTLNYFKKITKNKIVMSTENVIYNAFNKSWWQMNLI